ncbi:hypothetical protein TNIN_65181, partial [Trichonephila inaurata madagascariensis]
MWERPSPHTLSMSSMVPYSGSTIENVAADIGPKLPELYRRNPKPDPL